MKRTAKILFVYLILFLGARFVYAGDTSYNRVKFSFTLSGHLLFGLGFEHGLDEHHALQIGRAHV